ncbi:hypothetical protein D3C71_1473750 [compost metagenome]
MGEIRRQVHAVVGDARFFTKYGDVELVFVCFFQQIFDKPVADHAVTDDSKFDSAHYCLKILIS